MTDTGGKYGDQPLGKSVEEIERESGNVRQSPVEGEAQGGDGVVVVPAISNINETAVPGVIVNPGALVEPGAGPDDGRVRPARDSSEE